MEKTASKLDNNKTKVRELFEASGTDKFYIEVKKECYSWHSAAKIYWQQLYEKHRLFLDNDFVSKLPNECFSRLWELTQLNCIAQHQNLGAKLVHLLGKASKPDFCFTLQKKNFIWRQHILGVYPKIRLNHPILECMTS